MSRSGGPVAGLVLVEVEEGSLGARGGKCERMDEVTWQGLRGSEGQRASPSRSCRATRATIAFFLTLQLL